MATTLVQHNIPLALADKLTPLFCVVLSDSENAKDLSSKLTKTACIINGVVTLFSQHSLVDCMRSNPFAVASDSGIEKMNPLTAHIFDTNCGVT